MSLINQMLKDLESRQQGAISGEVQPVSFTRPSPHRRRILLLAGVAVGLLLAGLFFSQQIAAPGKIIRSADAPAVAEKPAQETAAGKSAPAVPVALPVERPGPDVATALPTTVTLKAMRLSEFDTFAHFEADFDRPPVYHVALGKDRHSLRVDLAEVESLAKPPRLVGQRWLQQLRVVQQDSGLAIKLLAKPELIIRDFSATVQVAGGGYRLLLDLHPELPLQAENQQQESPKTVEQASAAGVNEIAQEVAEADLQTKAVAGPDSPEPADKLLRSERQPSAAKLAEQAYLQGRTALAEGRSQGGETALRQALEQQPAHLAAREALVAELLRQQRPEEAGRLLREGVQLHPAQLPLRMRYADHLVAQGAPEKALDLLLEGPQPVPAEAPRLHALQAALFQRLGRYEEAAREYQALLATQPDNGLWLMGLAIAREHSGAAEEAVTAYRAALAGRGLSPALNSYVRQRLAALRAE